MVSAPTASLRLSSAGVVTCLVVAVPETGGIEAQSAVGTALARGGAVVVMPTGQGIVGAFHRVTDALRAALELRDHLPASRVALCSGETGARGEFTRVADKASRLVDNTTPGSTVLSKLAAALALDHLPGDRVLLERSEPGSEPSYELLTA